MLLEICLVSLASLSLTRPSWKEKQLAQGLKAGHLLGFPGGAVVENLPANAGDMGSSPGLGRSHMPWSSWAREPQLLSLRVWSRALLQERRR